MIRGITLFTSALDRAKKKKKVKKSCQHNLVSFLITHDARCNNQTLRGRFIN